MKSVADDLRRDRLGRQQSLSALERIRLSLSLGEMAARWFAESNGLSLVGAKLALQRQRQTGRRRSACHDAILS